MDAKSASGFSQAQSMYQGTYYDVDYVPKPTARVAIKFDRQSPRMLGVIKSVARFMLEALCWQLHLPFAGAETHFPSELTAAI